MKGDVVGTHVVLKQGVEPGKGGNGADIKGIKPAFLQRTEMPLNFAFAGSVTDFCMKKQHAERYADHGQLFIGITAAIIDIELIRDTIRNVSGAEDKGEN